MTKYQVRISKEGGGINGVREDENELLQRVSLQKSFRTFAGIKTANKLPSQYILHIVKVFILLDIHSMIASYKYDLFGND